MVFSPLAQGDKSSVMLNAVKHGLPLPKECLDFTQFNISYEGYNEQHQVYQIFIPLDASETNLDHLRVLQVQYPQVNIQYLFEKTFSRC